ncbi:MAG TPA: glutaredoxin domain-containing protein [Thermodesulfobacteriota bacterium]|nr:glutaredoxin domain-containing protein [Thermodesulfobacteriota bacterium]
MSTVVIYTTTYCPYCRAAKRLLESKGVNYEEFDLTENEEIKTKVMEELGWQSVPIILINEKLIGGYDQLRELEREGKLDEMFK